MRQKFYDIIKFRPEKFYKEKKFTPEKFYDKKKFTEKKVEVFFILTVDNYFSV